MLIALNAGLPGMATVHANSAQDVVARLETMVLMAADLPLASAVDEFFWPHRVSSFPVLEGDRLVGILGLTHVKQVPRERWPADTCA